MDYYWKTKEWIQKEYEEGIGQIDALKSIREPEVSNVRKDLIKFYKLLSETLRKEWNNEFIFSEITKLNNNIKLEKLSEREHQSIEHRLKFFEHSYFLLHDPNYKSDTLLTDKFCNEFKYGFDWMFLSSVCYTEMYELKEKGDTTFEESFSWTEEGYTTDKIFDAGELGSVHRYESSQKPRDWWRDKGKKKYNDLRDENIKETDNYYDNFDLDKEYEKRKNW